MAEIMNMRGGDDNVFVLPGRCDGDDKGIECSRDRDRKGNDEGGAVDGKVGGARAR